MEFIKKHKKAYMAVVVIICLVLIIVTILYRTRPTFVENALASVVVPAQNAFSNAFTFIDDKIAFLRNLESIEAENERLSERLKELEAENSRLALVDAENEKLTKLLELSQKYSSYSKVGAQITAKDPGNWYDVFVIDKGENDGFTRNMVVMADGGLVGRIVESGSNWSKVVSLIDDTFSVSAKALDQTISALSAATQTLCLTDSAVWITSTMTRIYLSATRSLLPISMKFTLRALS